LEQDRSKYTPVPGILELREAIARKTQLQQPSLTEAWKASQVLVTNGGKQAIFNAMMAVLEPGDEVFFPAPFWISYPEMTRLVGGEPFAITTEFKDSFKLTVAQLSAALDRATRPKLLIVNSPCNPTGALYSREEFAALGTVIATHPKAADLWVLSDEIYDRVILSEQPFCSFLEACPGLRSRVITVNGMSKAAAMTGWRIGWSIAESAVTSAMNTVQAQSTSGINALAQWASLAALKLPEEAFSAQLNRYQARLQLVLEILSKAGKLKVVVPKGAFYVFFGIEAYMRAGETAGQFCERALHEAKVALVPGDPFGMPGFVRMSFATHEATLKSGCERLVDYLTKSG
jgi:aspartate aminotransferase